MFSYYGKNVYFCKNICFMAENLDIIEGTKEEKYAALYPQIKSVVEDESDTIANMANMASMIHETFGFWWTGFYRCNKWKKV